MMKNRVFISISGKAGSGKDTFADLLEVALINKIKFKREAFANKLKLVCSALTSLPIDTFFYRDKKNMILPDYGITIRELLQKIGDELRKVDNGIWINALSSSLRKYKGNYIITDARYLNEIEFIKSLGGITIKIERPFHTDDSITNELSKHPSENEFEEYDSFNFTVINDKDLKNLKIMAEKVADEIWNKVGNLALEK